VHENTRLIAIPLAGPMRIRAVNPLLFHRMLENRPELSSSNDEKGIALCVFSAGDFGSVGAGGQRLGHGGFNFPL